MDEITGWNLLPTKPSYIFNKTKWKNGVRFSVLKLCDRREYRRQSRNNRWTIKKIYRHIHDVLDSFIMVYRDGDSISYQIHEKQMFRFLKLGFLIFITLSENALY